MTEFTETNRRAFDSLSQIYGTKPWQRALSALTTNALLNRKPWLDFPPNPRLLDYASGPGTFTLALTPALTPTARGIDLSASMVERYNAAASAAGLAPEQAHAVAGDLCAEGEVEGELTAPEWYGFDAAVIGLGFHHFDSPQRAVSRLAERLKAGSGVLVIVDFLPFEAEGHGESGGMGEMQRTIKHSGFSEAEMRGLYEGAGFEGFGFEVLREEAVMETSGGTRRRRVFVARGTRGKGIAGKLWDWVVGIQEKAGGQMGLDEGARSQGGGGVPGFHSGRQEEVATGKLGMFGERNH